PTSTITYPANNGSYKNSTWAGAITGTATTAGTNLTVKVSIKRVGTNKYWNGSSFNDSTENFRLTTLVGTAWNLSFPSSNFTVDDSYVAHSLANDSNGDENGAGGVATFTIDNAAPAAPSAPLLAPGSNSGSNADTITNINT